MRYFPNTILLTLSLLLLNACSKEKKERGKIEDYVASKQLSGNYTPEGVFYSIDTLGGGGSPDINSTVQVSYKGYLLDGKTFDQTGSGKYVTFKLKEVIEGWQIGIPKFEKGGKGTIIIPSALGYGSYSQPGIPANSILVFDIVLKNWW